MTVEQEIYKTILEREQSGQPAVLVTVVKSSGSTPRKSGAKMLVLDDRRILGTVGGAMLEALAIDVAMDALVSGHARTETFNLNDLDRKQTKMICGGRVELFFEPIATSPWLYMFGAGHCGRAIALSAHTAGFHTVVIDDRAAFASRSLLPDADEIHCGDIPSIARALQYHAPAYVVIATHCHETDAETAIGVLENGLPHYFGIIGSRKKRIEMKRWLNEVIDPEEFERNVHMPIGIDIGAETPEEIAISVVAALIRIRRGEKGFSVSSSTPAGARCLPETAAHEN